MGPRQTSTCIRAPFPAAHRLRALALPLAAACLLGGCAPALSTLHPATVTPHRRVDAGMGYGLSVPLAGVGRSVSTAKRNVERTEDGEPLSDGDRDDLLRTSLGLAMNPPSFGSQYRVAYGAVPRGEIELRYALSAWRVGERYQVIVPEGERRLAGSVGLGVSRYVLDLGVPDYLDPIVDVDDFTRWDVDVPVLLGVSHDAFHLWGGPKLIASFASAGIDVCTQVDTGTRTCTERTVASLDGRSLYFAAHAGGAIGWKHAWVGAELTAAYVDTRVGGTLKTGTLDEERRFALGDVIVYPMVGLILRF